MGQSIFTNPITDSNPSTANPYTAGQTVDANITVSGIGRGTGISAASATNRYNASSWDTPAMDNNAYFQFTLTPNTGFEIDFVSFFFTSQASSTGPNGSNVALFSSVDGYTTTIGTPTIPAPAGSAGPNTISLSAAAYQNITGAITFRLYAWGASAGTGTFSINDFTFNGTVAAAIPTCNVTTGLAVTNITDMTADVQWDAVTGAAGYEYVVDQISTDPSGAGTATTNLTESVSGLTPSSTYYLHVRTNCGSGNFSAWTTISFMTLVTPCDVPATLGATNITDMTADVEWDAVTGASGYEYVVDQISTDPSGAGTSTTNLTESVAALSPSSTYYLHVRTDCGSGNFSAWTTISFSTLSSPCDAPANLAASNITDMTADVEWDAVTGASGYEYVVDQISTDPSGAGTSTTNLTEPISGLSPSSTYYLHVRTNCGSGNFSAWTTISFMTLVTPCDVPATLGATNVTDMSADVEWDAVTGAAGYEYVVDQISTDPSGAGTPTTNLTESVAALTPLTTYYLHVRTNCGSGNFSAWTTISFATLSSTCDAPANLDITNITDITADVEWDAVTGAAGYEYVVNEISTDPTSGIPTTNLTESVAGLTPLTTYYLHVRTDCGSGNFSAWSTLSFITDVAAPTCAIPDNIDITGISAVSATFSWDAVSGATGYEYLVNEIPADPSTPGIFTVNLIDVSNSLEPETTYYLHLRTACGGGDFSAWTTVSFTTDADLGMENHSTTQIHIYPNPVAESLTVTFENALEKINYSILNASGQIVYNAVVSTNGNIDVSFLAPGIYYIRLESESVIEIQKIIKK